MAAALRGRRGAAAVRRAARLRGHRPRRAHARRAGSTCPFTGEELAAVPRAPPGRRRSSTRSRPTGGQRAAVGHQRRAEGGRARRRPRARDGRGGRRRARAAARRRRPAVVGGRRGRGRAGRRAPVVRARLLRPRQRLLRRLGRDQPRPRDASPPGCGRHVLETGGRLRRATGGARDGASTPRTR